MVVISKRIMIETCATTQMKDNSKQFSKSILVPCLCQDIGDNYPSNVRPVFCVATDSLNLYLKQAQNFSLALTLS